jgi:hypothetical protein
MEHLDEGKGNFEYCGIEQRRDFRILWIFFLRNGRGKYSTMMKTKVAVTNLQRVYQMQAALPRGV